MQNEDHALREADILLTELLDGPSNGKFYGILGTLHAKLETVRLTVRRAALSATPTQEAIPADVLASVQAIGEVEWGATDAKSGEMHGRDVENSVRLTAEHFEQIEPQPMHGLYLKGTETVLCHTGTSPNSGQHARILAGAWNYLLGGTTPAPAPIDNEALVEEVARAMRRNRFERTRRMAAFDETVPPSDIEMNDARAAVRAVLALPSIATCKPSLQVQPSFQSRVQPWLLACFGEEIATDREERNHRFLEEALELVQSLGCTASEAHQLVDYTFGRPIGEPAQEVGGVMVTLAALCLANGLQMDEAGETELARIWTKVEKIRAKQAAKPKYSPLPETPKPTTSALVEEAIGALGKCGRQFSLYAAEHQNKADLAKAEDQFLTSNFRDIRANASYRKAETNQQFADLCSATLAKLKEGRA